MWCAMWPQLSDRLLPAHCYLIVCHYQSSGGHVGVIAVPQPNIYFSILVLYSTHVRRKLMFIRLHYDLEGWWKVH